MATRDFSRKRENITFTIDGEVFEAVPALPGDVLAEFAVRFTGTEDTDDLSVRLSQWKAALELVLQPESYARFTARMKDPERPIELEQSSEIIVWLLEQYGMRPTQPPSPSSDGSPSQELGTNSMVDAPGGESTSPPSQPIAS